MQPFNRGLCCSGTALICRTDARMTKRSVFVLISAAILTASCVPFTASNHMLDADPDRVVAAIGSHDVVLLGEVHDNVDQHALRVQVLRRWIERGARPALLMEQFDREHQHELDRALVRPEASVDSVIAAAGVAPTRPGQGWQWQLYRPYVQLAIDFRLPIVAANVSRADARRVVADGLQALGFDPNVPADIAEAQSREIVESHCGQLNPSDALRLVAAQVARDQFMARAVEGAAPRAAVLLAGNGHIRSDIGVPRWLSPATRGRSVAIGLLELDTASERARFDLSVKTRAQARPDPCDAMRGAASSGSTRNAPPLGK
jgi:uncharacterized iron-regulated protein